MSVKRLFKRKIKNNEVCALEAPWTKFYNDIPKNLNYFQGTISELLGLAVQKHPDLIAYEYYGITCTYKEFLKKIEETAKALKAFGVAENDHITICMPNTPQGIILFYAVNMVGGIASMIHPLSAEKEIEFYLNVTKSKYLFTIDLAYNKIMNIIDESAVLKTVVISPAQDFSRSLTFFYWLKQGRKLNIKLKHENIYGFKQFLAAAKDYQGNYKCHKSSESLALILYSGGTTGTPKGIMLSNKNFNAMAEQASLMCNTKVGESVLAIMPIFHGFGLTVSIHTPLISGMKCILIPDFSSRKFAYLIRKYHPNFVVGVPTLFEALTKSLFKKDELKCIKEAISGGDTLDEKLKLKVDAFLKKHGSLAEVREGYGLTECAGAASLMPAGNYRRKSIGIPFPDNYFKIVVNGTHEEAEIGTDGEICISGPTVMCGYLNNLEETMQTLRIHEDGRIWLHTGDIGSMDEDGFIYFKQRLKRVIISSGYNVYPSHIESVINAHSAVLTSTVIGVKHPYKVQVAKAYVVLKEGYEPNETLKKEILSHCQKNLAKYSMPAFVEFKDSLPKTLVGKVAYKELEKEN